MIAFFGIHSTLNLAQQNEIDVTDYKSICLHNKRRVLYELKNYIVKAALTCLLHIHVYGQGG